MNGKMNIEVTGSLLLLIIFLLSMGFSNAQNTLKEENTDSTVSFFRKKASEFELTYPDSALFYAKKTIQALDVEADQFIMAEMNMLIGSVLEKQGNYGLSIDYLNKALEIYEKLKLPLMKASTLNQLGRVNAEALLIEAALEHLEASHEIFLQARDNLQLAWNLFYTGYTFERAFLPQIALEHYDRVDSIIGPYQADELRFTLTEAYASIYEDLEQYDSAMVYYRKVNEMIEENVFEKIDVLNNIGDVYRKTSRYEEAKEYYLQALELAKNRNSLRQIEQNIRDLAYTYEGLSEKDSAIALYKESMQMYREFYSQQNANHMNQMQILFELDQKNREIELQRSKAQQSVLQRNLFIVVTLLFIFISASLWYGARQKHRLNMLLKARNNRIEKQKEELEKTNEDLQNALDDLHKAQDQLVQTEKMASVGTLVAGVAHEINNPLNFIHGGVSTLGKYMKTMDERQQETMRPMIHAIQTGVDRTMKLVKSLNHFNRHTESEKEECQVETIIDNCLNLLNYRLKYGINVHKDFTNTHYHCMANESQLHQVFLNIINNAAQAIDNNGDIWIKTELLKDQLQIKILDNGKGIARSDLKRIFDPFYTTKAPGEGTGLGLAISRKIILAHNGDIQIHSTPDKGTEVTITLPVSE